MRRAEKGGMVTWQNLQGNCAIFPRSDSDYVLEAEPNASENTYFYEAPVSVNAFNWHPLGAGATF